MLRSSLCTTERCGAPHTDVSASKYLMNRIVLCCRAWLPSRTLRPATLAAAAGLSTLGRHMIRYSRLSYLALPVLWCLGTQISVAKGEPVTAASADPQQLVRVVVSNELRASESDHSHWMYRDHDVEPAKDIVKECVETSAGQICRVLERGGHMLTPEEREQEKHHIAELVKNPSEQKKKQKEHQEDDRKAAELVNMLPHGFLYQYDGEEGNYIRLRFRPNPDFTPPSREATVFHCMAGTMLIDRRQLRLADMKGTLIRNVDFGWGVLGRLIKGGTFEVKREDVGEGHWVSTMLDVHIHGKALFFKTINAEQHEVDENFKRVPDHLTLEAGASMLETSGLQASATTGFRSFSETSLLVVLYKKFEL
jgi:hypothetical protein